MSPDFVPPDPSRRVMIGRIVKVRGLRGDLKVLPFTWRPERFLDLKGVWLTTLQGEDRYLTFKRVRLEQAILFVRFNEAPRRDLAEVLVGAELFVDEADRDPLPADTYYFDDLLGCEVICSQRGDLGRLVEVMDLPANDVWRVEGPYGEILIPAIHEVVDEVDLKAKRIRVTLPDGLIDEEKPTSQS